MLVWQGKLDHCMLAPGLWLLLLLLLVFGAGAFPQLLVYLHAAAAADNVLMLLLQ
jgi:hypothetical protein